MRRFSNTFSHIFSFFFSQESRGPGCSMVQLHQKKAEQGTGHSSALPQLRQPLPPSWPAACSTPSATALSTVGGEVQGWTGLRAGLYRQVLCSCWWMTANEGSGGKGLEHAQVKPLVCFWKRRALWLIAGGNKGGGLVTKSMLMARRGGSLLEATIWTED